ncbi:hypothetical protein WNY37_18160 [Henriciella sp. AS95]|uniref:Ig-like domain-containing protein n=1 Tax=Henriciella sp. AS95 TaxID=3135782 RepID=UPI00316F6748
MRYGLGICLAVLVLSGCGGSGGGGSSNPSPVNRSPQFTSPASATVEENTAGVILTARASDADGDPVRFSISGGADAAAFDLGATSGNLRFSSPPDFESPADSDGNNVYALTLQASDDAGGTASQSVTVTVTDVDESSAGVRYRDRVFSNVTTQRNLPFANVDGQTLRMDVFSPQNDTATDRPVMILAFPGGFVEGERSDMEEVAVDFAQRGYVSATIDYRLLSSIPASRAELVEEVYAATHDLFAAVRYFRADAIGANSFGIREDAILVGGASAGAVMGALAAVLDPDDSISDASARAYLSANGGVYGDVGENDGVSSTVQGAFVISGGVTDIDLIDAESAPIYASHEELDPEIPCGSGQEGVFFTGLSVWGSCAMRPEFDALGIPFGLFVVDGAVSHLGYSDQQIEDITQEAADLFFSNIISGD